MNCHLLRFVRSYCLVSFIALMSLGARSTMGHVIIDNPNGGESLTGGANFLIEWRPQVAPHDTLNFDVWYSTAGDTGPWTTIALDLPPGDLAVDSLHSHNWLVPNISDSSVWLRVRQENGVDVDYEDVSDASFSIAAASGLEGDYNGNEIVDAADYSVWRDSLGLQGAGLAADGNHDNRVDGADYTLWKANFGDSAGSSSAQLRCDRRSRTGGDAAVRAGADSPAATKSPRYPLCSCRRRSAIIPPCRDRESVAAARTKSAGTESQFNVRP